MTRFVCVHGHFYQPPRENPWTGAVDRQPSAAPYHDWNERITEECYAVNGAPIAIERAGEVVTLAPNYPRISFDFGPTLLSWLEENAPGVYASILRADRDSRERFSGHGSAMALAYSHPILPLANARDRRTHVIWGIRDFEHRFHRSPEGMWLPETAADVATLETVAEQGIRFTIMAPSQALRWRSVGEEEWRDTDASPIDTRVAYEAPLPSGRRIALFFYDGPTSHAVAFGALAEGGEALAARLASRFSGRQQAELAHVATDGETYGHHFRGGEKVLAEALEILERSGAVRLTNYGEFLATHPPEREVEIGEKTAWSCPHELKRWSGECGCRIGGEPDWTSAWRGWLKDALDWLRDELALVFERAGAELFRDPWRARDGYIGAVLDHSPEIFRELLARHERRRLTEAEERGAGDLLEMERYVLLMYTSCGWFFDDPSGLETTQILRYAARAIELAREVESAPAKLEEEFLRRLEKAESHDPVARDAAQIYRRARGVRVT